MGSPDGAATPPPSSFIVGRPESNFAVRPAQLAGATSAGSMTTGHWMLGPDGRPSRGTLGVLIDNVLGSAVLAHREPDHWGVSTEISIDFCATLPADGSQLRCESDPLEITAEHGLSTGLVRDAAGRPVAFGTERLRFFHGSPAGLDELRVEFQPDQQPAKGADVEGITELLRSRWEPGSDGGRLVLPADGELANPSGVLHGGVVICAAELAGASALGRAEDPLQTSAVRIAFLRPGPLSGEVTFAATVLHRGRSFGVCQVLASNDAGKVFAAATITADRAPHFGAVTAAWPAR